MEIEIKGKINNPFFKRTEVQFIIKHENQGTPNQAIIRNELAEVLKIKKEFLIIDSIDSSFGIQKTRGYAKVYNSRKEAEQIERKHFLNRNKIGENKPKKNEGESSSKIQEETTSTDIKEEKVETDSDPKIKEEES